MIPFPDKKYRILYADPPWKFGSRRCSRPSTGEQTPLSYRTQTVQWILDLPVRSISLANSVLFLWTTDAHLPSALRAMSAWGFAYKTVGFVWYKKTARDRPVFVMGNWTNKSTELCLLGARGQPHAFLVRRDVRQLVEAKRDGHSAKPDEVRERIVQMFGDAGPRIELFARERHRGWDSWGDELPEEKR